MTDKEIIKAFKCCSDINDKCFECPLKDKSRESCVGILMSNALDLINRLQAENESIRRKALLEAASKFAGHSNYHGDTIVVENEKNIVRLPTLYPMGAMTFAVACSVCKNEGKEFCKECKCEIESHFEIK